MIGFLKKIFGSKKKEEGFTQEEFEKSYNLKISGLEAVLGKSHDMVGHAIIPFFAGGTVDMYYFPNSIKGTGFATMEFIQPDGKGPVPNRLGTYELVAFTKDDYVQQGEEVAPFNKLERRVCGIFTGIGLYSFQVKLEPLETCELPQEEGQPKICLIFDEYRPDNKDFYIGDRKHGLLLVMEIHKEEMKYAMENGGENLINKLKEKGFYPYSDMGRDSVV